MAAISTVYRCLRAGKKRHLHFKICTTYRHYLAASGQKNTRGTSAQSGALSPASVEQDPFDAPWPVATTDLLVIGKNATNYVIRHYYYYS